MTSTTITTVAAAAKPATTTTAKATSKPRTTRAAKVEVQPIRKAVAEQPALLASKAAQEPLKEDYTYLAEKEPTDLHKEMAAWMTEVTGVPVSAKQAQIVAVLRHEFQRSEVNQESLAKKRKEAAARKVAAAKAKEAREKKLLADLQAKFAEDAKASKAKAAAAKKVTTTTAAK